MCTYVLFTICVCFPPDIAVAPDPRVAKGPTRSQSGVIGPSHVIVSGGDHAHAQGNVHVCVCV